MSEKIVEAVAKALAQADGFHPDAVSNDEDSVPAWSLYMDMARAAIEAYEAAAAAWQEMHDQRVIWEAVERMKINPPDTPLMDALKSGRLYK